MGAIRLAISNSTDEEYGGTTVKNDIESIAIQPNATNVIATYLYSQHKTANMVSIYEVFNLNASAVAGSTLYDISPLVFKETTYAVIINNSNQFVGMAVAEENTSLIKILATPASGGTVRFTMKALAE